MDGTNSIEKIKDGDQLNALKIIVEMMLHDEGKSLPHYVSSKLISFIQKSENDKLQVEALITLNKLTCDQRDLFSASDASSEESINDFLNGADGKELREQMIAKDVVEKILTLVEPKTPNFQEHFMAVGEFLASFCVNEDVRLNSSVVDKLLPVLKQLAQLDDCKVIEFSCLALCGLMRSNNVNIKKVNQAGFVTTLIEFLTSHQSEVLILKTAVKALHDIAEEEPELRDLVINAGAIIPLMNLIKPDMDEYLMDEVPDLLCDLYYHEDDVPLSSSLARQLQPPLNHLIRLLNHEASSVVKLSLEVTKCLYGELNQMLLDAGLCPLLAQLLKHADDDIVCGAVDTVDQIAYGNAELLFTHKLIEPFMTVFAEGTIKCKKKAVSTLNKITRIDGESDRATELWQLGAVASLCALLFSLDRKNSHDVHPIRYALQCLVKLLESENVSSVRLMMLRENKFHGSLERIKALQHHEDKEIENLALAILEQQQSLI